MSPTSENLAIIAKYYQISMDELAGITPPPAPTGQAGSEPQKPTTPPPVEKKSKLPLVLGCLVVCSGLVAGGLLFAYRLGFQDGVQQKVQEVPAVSQEKNEIMDLEDAECDIIDFSKVEVEYGSFDP